MENSDFSQTSKREPLDRDNENQSVQIEKWVERNPSAVGKGLVQLYRQDRDKAPRISQSLCDNTEGESRKGE